MDFRHSANCDVRPQPRGKAHWQVALLCLVLLGCTPRISQPDATRKAAAELQRYCTRNQLPAANFRVTSVTAASNGPWVVEYRALAGPRYEVVVYVERNGAVELNALPPP